MSNNFQYLFLVALSVSAFAQKNEANLKRLSLDDGLSQGSVICILQDSRGFMWFGTEDGLNRYDGYEFKVYHHAQDDSASLSSSDISVIVEDDSGDLWIGTMLYGFNRFDRETETFERYEIPSTTSGRNCNEIKTLYFDSQGLLWIGTLSGGLLQFNRKINEFAHYFHQPGNPGSISSNSIEAIMEDSSGTIWVGTNGGGLNRLEKDKGSFKSYRHNPGDSNSISSDYVYSILIDHAGNFWVEVKDALEKFDTRTGRFIHYGNPSGDFDRYGIMQHLVDGGSNALWIGAEYGLYKFDKQSGAFKFYGNKGNPRSNNPDQIRSLFKDNAGNMWVGAYGSITIFNPESNGFLHYTKDENDSNTLSDYSIRALHEDSDGMLWVGGNGLDKFDRRTGKVTSYFHASADFNAMTDVGVWSIIQGSDGFLWLGTYGAGVIRFDKHTGDYKQYVNSGIPGSVSHNRVWSLFEDSKGMIWIATASGLTTFDRSTGTFTRHYGNPADSFSLSSSNVRYVTEDMQGAIWIGTVGGGLNKLISSQAGNLKFKRYTHSPNNLNGLSHNFINYILPDSSDILWIGTYGGGLNKFDAANEVFTQYTEKDGLPNDVVYAILKDDNGFLWMSTNKGISKFNPRTETFRNYDARDGLQGNEFNSAVCFRNSKGEMLFGGQNGFNVFHPDSIIDNLFEPPVVFTDFQLFNKPVAIGNGSPLKKSISETDEITLTREQSVFSLGFAALNYALSEKNQYAYKLEGFDKDWNHIGTRRSATFTNLNPGRYTLRVKGSNNDGLWSSREAALNIIVLPAFWQTWWFRALMLLAAVALITGFAFARYRLRLNQVLERQKIREQIYHDLHDDLGTEISNIKRLGEGMNTGEHKHDSIENEVRKLVQYSGNALDKLHELVWAVNPKYDTLDKFISEVERMLEKQTASTGIKAVLQNHLGKNELQLEGHLRHHLLMICKEAVNNACKYSRASVIEINIGITGNKTICISIKDNGCGFDKSKLKPGNGLVTMRERAVNKCGGKFQLESEPGRGTQISVAVPFT